MGNEPINSDALVVGMVPVVWQGLMFARLFQASYWYQNWYQNVIRTIDDCCHSIKYQITSWYPHINISWLFTVILIHLYVHRQSSQQDPLLFARLWAVHLHCSQVSTFLPARLWPSSWNLSKPSTLCDSDSWYRYLSSQMSIVLGEWTLSLVGLTWLLKTIDLYDIYLFVCILRLVFESKLYKLISNGVALMSTKMGVCQRYRFDF